MKVLYGLAVSIVLLFGLTVGTGAAVVVNSPEELAPAVAQSPVVKESAPVTPPPTEAPPLPLHNIEGAGGVGLTEMAYLVNPSTGDDIFGLPAVSITHVFAAHKDASIFTVSETLFKRLELSYALQRVGLGDFPNAVEKATGKDLSSDTVTQHVLNARYLLVNEGAFGQKWLPALTAGVHYKYNANIDDFNHDLGGALTTLGVKDNQGWEGTLTGTKLITGVLPHPFFVSGTLRNSDAAQFGWLGFTGKREWLWEGNVGYFLTDKLILATEYRQKPDPLKRVPGALGHENDAWSVAASYIISPHINVSVALVNLGNMLNHREPAATWLQLKYEF